MENTKEQSLHNALYRILRPLARLLLRNGISFGEFSDLVKRAYVDAALEDFRENRKKPTDSRAAVMTGLTRKDVKRNRELLAGHDVEPVVQHHVNRASRVVSGWVNDPKFQDHQGEPEQLTFDGKGSFSELVRRYSGDMTPRAVLDELLRVGVVEERGGLVLRKRAYVPTGDDAGLLNIFGEDVADLIRTVDFNLSDADENSPPLFQRTLTYNNIPVEVLEQWRKHAAKQSQLLLEQLDKWLSPKDQDVSGSTTSSQVARTGVGIFFFQDLRQAGADREQS